MHYHIDAPTEGEVITSSHFHLQGWVTFEKKFETKYFLSDGKNTIQLMEHDRPDVRAAFPKKHVFGFSQQINTTELNGTYCFVTFKGPDKEYRFLIPIQIQS